MNAKAILWFLAVVLLVVNIADFATTYVAIISGSGAEANPLVLLLGGALSPPAILLKLAVIPGLILAATWWLTRKFNRATIGIVTILPPIVALGAAAANNVLVIAKKARKVIRKKDEKKWRKDEGKERKTRKWTSAS